MIVGSPSLISFLVPCLGYVFRESPTEWDLKGKDEEAQAAFLGRLRKLVLLGDTNNPDGIIPLVNSSPGHVALAVHEATDCYIPIHVDPQQQTGRNRSTESVHSLSLQRGHSTPHMAGKFANEIGARRLVLNHLGGRYDGSFSRLLAVVKDKSVLTRRICRFPAPGKGGRRDNEFREDVMDWIEQQATEAWAPAEDGARAVAAVDFLTVHIKPVPTHTPSQFGSGVPEPQMQWSQMPEPASTSTIGQSSGQASGHGWRHGRDSGGPSTPSNEKVPRKRQKTEKEVQRRGGGPGG